MGRECPRSAIIHAAKVGEGSRGQGRRGLTLARAAAYLADVGRLAAHVGPRDDLKVRCASNEGDVVWDEGNVVLHLQARVPRRPQRQVALP